MPRCVQCTVSKKKCNPENRQWPELCNLCIKSGLPCSPDLDCLFYLRAGILEWRPLSSGIGPICNDGLRTWNTLREILLGRLESVITEVQSEASNVIHQCIARGRGREAYFLADLLDRKDCYAKTAIISDYHDQVFASRASTTGTYKKVNKALLDRSAGLLFRWFRGTTVNCFTRTEVERIVVSSPITREEATQLYATLKTVSNRCKDGNFQDIYNSGVTFGQCQGSRLAFGDIFVRIDPPLLRYLGIWDGTKESTLQSNWMEGLSNLISGGNAVGILDSMTLRQESLMQLVLQGPRSEYMLHSVEKAVACGLNPAAFHLPYCLGEIPPLTENNVRIMALSEIILAPIAGLHVNVTRQEILKKRLIPYEGINLKFFDDVQMSPLMHALYTRRYSVVYAILVSKNPAWVVQTSKTALSDMLELPHRGGKLFGPIHVAAWTYVACESRSNCDTYATEIFSKLCQNPIQLASAIEIAINMENKKLVVLLCELAFTMIRSQSHYGVAYGLLGSVLLNKPWNGWGWGWRGDWQDEKWFILLVSLRKELKKIVIRDLAPLTQSPRAAETIRRSGDADKEPDISDREHNDKRIGYESQAELASTEDNGNRNSANTKASQQKRNETQNEKDGYGSAQGGKSFVNQQHKPMVDFDTLNESKPENDRQTRSSIGSNPAHPKNHIPSWGAQQRQWKVSGGKLSNGSGIMSLASKASASTASSGLSVISFGGMPFTQPRGRGLNFEKPALEEEPEFMDIDGIPTSPP